MGDADERVELRLERGDVSNGRRCGISRCIQRVHNSAVDIYASASGSVDPLAPAIELNLLVTLQSNLSFTDGRNPINTTNQDLS